MSDIFISYARENDSEARQLAKALEGSGWSVFWDQKIRAGKTWREVTGAALGQARCVVVLWSRDSVESRWVLEEAEIAGNRNVLVPVLIEDVSQPLGFGGIQAANLIDWDGSRESRNFTRLVTDLANILGTATGKVSPELDGAAPATARTQKSTGNTTMPDFLTTLVHVLASKKIPIAAIVVLVAGYVATQIGPEGTEKSAAIMTSASFSMLAAYFFFNNLKAFPKKQRGALTIVVLSIFSVLMVFQARAAIEFFQAVLDDRALAPEQGTDGSAVQLEEVPNESIQAAPAEPVGEPNPTEPQAQPVSNPPVPTRNPQETRPDTIDLFVGKIYRFYGSEQITASDSEFDFELMFDSLQSIREGELVDSRDFGLRLRRIRENGFLELENMSAWHIESRWGDRVLSALIEWVDDAHRISQGEGTPLDFSASALNTTCRLSENSSGEEDLLANVTGTICVAAQMRGNTTTYIFDELSPHLPGCLNGINIFNYRDRFVPGCSRYCSVDDTSERISYMSLPPELGSSCTDTDGREGRVTDKDVGPPRPMPPSLAPAIYRR